MFGQMMDQPLLISEQIEFAARFHGAVEVVTRTVEGPIHRSSWGEVARRVRQLAHALQRLGIGPGDRVATLAWNTHRHLEVYFAVSSMGAVLHTINPRLPLDQLRYVVDHAEDMALFFDTTFLKLAQFLAKQSTPVRHYVALCDAAHLPTDAGIPGLADYEGLIAGERDTVRLAGAGRENRLVALLHLGHCRVPEGRALLPPLDSAPLVCHLHGRRAGHLRRGRHAAGRADVPRQRLGCALCHGDDRIEAGAAGAGPRPGQPARAHRDASRPPACSACPPSGWRCSRTPARRASGCPGSTKSPSAARPARRR